MQAGLRRILICMLKTHGGCGCHRPAGQRHKRHGRMSQSDTKSDSDAAWMGLLGSHR